MNLIIKRVIANVTFTRRTIDAIVGESKEQRAVLFNPAN